MIVGAYAAEPPSGAADAEAYWRALAASTDIAGWELPVVNIDGALHAKDEAAMLRSLFPSDRPRRFVLTLIPATMAALGRNPHFGLASDNDEGRCEALALVAAAREALLR